MILPFLEEGPLHQQIDFNISVFATASAAAVNSHETLLVGLTMKKFICPSDPRKPRDEGFNDAPGMSASSYIGNFGTNGYVQASGGSQNVSWQDARWYGGYFNTLNAVHVSNNTANITDGTT